MRRKLYSFAIDPALLRGIRAIKQRDGISESEQIRRGLALWLARYRRIKRVAVPGTTSSRRRRTR